MRIESLNIYGYGKFVDAEFNVDPKFQVFYGANESGKTTLYDFIEQILFGFPDRRHMERRHEPSQSSNYGGSLVLRDEKFGRVYVERKGKEVSAGEVTLRFEDGTTGGLEELAVLLRGIDLSFYQNIYSVNLDTLQNLAVLTESQLNRLLISVTSLGSERFIELAENYENMAQKMYTPESKTREIDNILENMNRLKDEINKAQSLNNGYSELYNEIEEIVARQNERENKITEKNKRIETLEKLLDKVGQYEAYQELNKELEERSKTFTPVRETDKRRFDSLREKENQVNSELEKLERRKQEVQEYEHLPAELIRYQQNEEEWDKIFNAMDRAEEMLDEKKNLERSEDTLARDIERDKARLGIKESNENLRDFDHSEMKEIDIIERRVQNLTQKKNKKEAHLMTLRVQEENLKNELQQLSLEMEEEGEEVDAAVLDGLALSAGISLLLSIIISSSFRYVFLIAAIIMLTLSIYNHLQNTNEKSAQSFSRENIKNNIMDKQTQHEELLRKITRHNTEIQRLEGLIAEETTQWAYLKEEAGINNQWTIEEYKTYQAYYSDLISNIKKLENYAYNKQKSFNRLTEHMEILELIKEEIDTSFSLERIIEQVKELQKRIDNQKKNAAEAIQSVGYIQREIARKKSEREELEKNMKDFYSDFQVEDAEEFLEIYDFTDKFKEKEAARDQLYEALKSYLEEFSKADSFQDWEEKIVRLDHEIDLLHKEKEQDDDLRTDKRAQMQRIEQGGELSDLIQQYEDKRAILQEKVDERTIYQVASEIIKRVLKHANEDASPKLLEFAESIFKTLTQKNYIRIYLKDGGVELVRNDKEIFKAHELSTGTKEQLYLSLKLAFLKMMTDRFSLPLLIDDGFVNFDENRKKEVVQILHQFSEDNQIIYFTFDDTGIETLRSDQVTML